MYTFPSYINSYIYKNVRSNVLICEPSTSASVSIIILPYLSFSILKSSPNPLQNHTLILI